MYQQCQPLVWDPHSSNLGVSERRRGWRSKGRWEESRQPACQALFKAKFWAVLEVAPSRAELLHRHQKVVQFQLLIPGLTKPSAKGFQKHLSLGHLKCCVRPATCSPIISIPRSSRRAASSVRLRSSLFSITGLRGGSDESGTHCFILAEQASNLVCLASCPQSGPTVPSVVWGDLTWVTLGFHCPSFVLPVWPYLPLLCSSLSVYFDVGICSYLLISSSSEMVWRWQCVQNLKYFSAFGSNPVNSLIFIHDFSLPVSLTCSWWEHFLKKFLLT